MFLCHSSETVADMQESWSNNDVDNAIRAIRVIVTRVGALPQVLLHSYQHEIEIGELEMTRRFYEQLTIHCPDALDLFTLSAAEEREATSDRPRGPPRPIPIE
jgi:hypothetical protein